MTEFRGRCHNCAHGQRYNLLSYQGQVVFLNQIYKCLVPENIKFTDPNEGLTNYRLQEVRHNFRCPLWLDRRQTKTP